MKCELPGAVGKLVGLGVVKSWKAGQRDAWLAAGRGVRTKTTGSAAFPERRKLPRARASKPECLMRALKSHSHSGAAVPRFPKSAFVSLLVQQFEVDTEWKGFPGLLSSDGMAVSRAQKYQREVLMPRCAQI